MSGDVIDDNQGWSWLKIFLVSYIVLQVIMGILLFEFAWKSTEKFRKKDDSHSKFPEFRRNDEPWKWSRWTFYPGAILVTSTRFFVIFYLFIFCAFLVTFLVYGHNFENGPVGGWRRKCMQAIIKYGCYTVTLISGMKLIEKDVKFDYSEYLGSNYEQNYKKIKRTSTVVANHTSWLDAYILFSYMGLAIAPDAGFAKAPVLGPALKAMDSIFIPRAKSQEDKDKALLALKTRQEEIEEKGKYLPFILFAEGATSNGTHMFSFKKGAFVGERRITPVYLKYKFSGFSTDYSLFDLLPLVILTQTWIWGGLSCEVGIMPDFEPNEHMFQKFADKGNERWEVFAWCVRDAMARESSLKVTNVSTRAKLAYWNHLLGKNIVEDFNNKSVDEIIEAYNKSQQKPNEVDKQKPKAD